MANAVGAIAFILFLVVIFTVALKLNYFDLVIKTEKLPVAIVGEEYNVVLAGTGGNEPYSWKLVNGELPNELEFSNVETTVWDQNNTPHIQISGKISGRPTKPLNPINLTFELEDTPVQDFETGKTIVNKPPVRKTFQFEVRPPADPSFPLEIQTTQVPLAVWKEPYNLQLAALGGRPPYHWSIVGRLPKGLEIDQINGKISGSPLSLEEQEFTLHVKDSSGQASSKASKIQMVVVGKDDGRKNPPTPKLTIKTVKIPDARKDRPYHLTFAAIGGNLPYEWKIQPGSYLPKGLALTNDGILMGIATEIVKTKKIHVTVSSSNDESASKEFTISVEGPSQEQFPLTLF